MPGGNYFIKYLVNRAPVYIQSPKCKTRGGILKTGKKIHCDLMFGNENEDFIKWMEDLEAFSCKVIYENREKWFESELEMSDIENYFSSPLKIYKSGKFYLTRANIASRLGKISLKIYDESEQIIDSEDVNENMNIITILELQGIKCSARSFQIEIEMKQMMILNPVDLFDQCLLHVEMKKEPNDSLVGQEVHVSSDEPPPNQDPYSLPQTTGIDTSNHLDENVSDNPVLDEYEVELHLDKISDSDIVQLKARKEVYYEMYHQARDKAKLARSMALAAYLEAKQIKDTYMLDDVEESDTDDDVVQKKISV